MENTQLISLSRQMALQRQMDVVANNLANISTTGFKAESVLFEDYMMPGASDSAFQGSDQKLHYTQDWSTLHDMTNGSIEPTSNPLDLALDGNGFLSIETPAGERYTRNGELQLDASGTLVDVNGNAVLTEAGPVHFDAKDGTISIAGDGSISTSRGAKGKLKLTEFDDPQVLAREGANYYSGPEGNPATSTQVVQGALERSNVSGVGAMVDMIRVERAYQTLANIIERQDTLRSTAVQRLADVNA
ncbi:MAG: flagellar basal-body rod protein FlgF [Devosia sp.]